MKDTSYVREAPIGVAHFSAIELPPAQFVKQAAAAGFNAVGLRLHPAFPGAPFYELPQGSQAASEFLAVLDGEGIKVFDIEFFVLGPDFNAASVEHIVAAASDIGAKRLSVCGDDSDHERLTGNLTAFCQLAARYGMAVDVENMGWRTINTYARSAELVKACKQVNAGALVDAIHFYRNGGNVSEINLDLVHHVQLCDVTGPAPSRPEDMMNEARTGRLAPGDGTLALNDLLLTAVGKAAISVEVPLVGNATPLEHLKDLNSKTRRVLQAVG